MISGEAHDRVVEEAARLIGQGEFQRCHELLKGALELQDLAPGLAEDVATLMDVGLVLGKCWQRLELTGRAPMAVPAGVEGVVRMDSVLQDARGTGVRHPAVEELLKELEGMQQDAKARISSARAWAICSLVMGGSLLLCIGNDQGRAVSLAGCLLLALVVAYIVLAKLPRYELYARFAKGETFGLAGFMGSLIDPTVVGEFLMTAVPGVLVAPVLALYDIYVAQTHPGGPS